MSTPKKPEEKYPNQINLDEPIKRGETNITSVMLRKPKSGELRGLRLVEVANANVDSLITLLPRITTPALTEHELNEMDPADFSALAVKVAGFLDQKSSSQ